MTPGAATSPATTLTRPPRINKAAAKTGHLTFKIGAGLTVLQWFMGRLRTYNKKGRGGGGAVTQVRHNARHHGPAVGAPPPRGHGCLDLS